MTGTAPKEGSFIVPKLRARQLRDFPLSAILLPRSTKTKYHFTFSLCASHKNAGAFLCRAVSRSPKAFAARAAAALCELLAQTQGKELHCPTTN